MVYYDKYGSQIKEYFSLKNNLPYDVTDIKIRISYFVNNNDINYKDVSLNGIIPSGLTKKYEIDSFDEDRMFVFADGNDNNKSRYTEFKIKYSVLDYKKYQPNELKNNDILADTITPNSMTDKYYIAYVTTAVNLRDAPSIDSNIIDKIPAKKFIFINSADKIGNYYHVIYIDKDIEGYVNSNFFKIYKPIKENRNGTLQVVGESKDYAPSIKIYNKANVSMTLRLGTNKYKFGPYEKKTIIASPGEINILVSSPGIQPYIGIDKLKNNIEYSWTFFVIHSYR